MAVAPGEYVIMTSHEQLDHELMTRYELTVSCKDHGENILSTNLLIVINVEDINDHRPVFTQTIYSAQVKENSEPLEVCIQTQKI